MRYGVCTEWLKALILEINILYLWMEIWTLGSGQILLISRFFLIGRISEGGGVVFRFGTERKSSSL